MDIISNLKIGLYSGHILTMVFFLVALSLIIKELIYLHNNDLIQDHPHRLTLFIALYSSMILSSVFVVLQIDWILQDHNHVVGNTTAFLWLTFDICLAIFMISFTVFVSSVRAKFEYCRELERIAKNRDRYDCIDLSCNERIITEEDERIIKDGVKESMEGLKVLRKRVLKVDNKYNSDNGCR